MGGPAIVQVDSETTCQVAVINTAPFHILLERNNFIGANEALHNPVATVQPIETLCVATVNPPVLKPQVSSHELTNLILPQSPHDRREELLELLRKYPGTLAQSGPASLSDP